MQEEVTRGAIVEYEYDLEYLLAAVEVLSPYDVNPKIGQVYNEEFKEMVRKKYPLLFEIYGSLAREFSTSFLEFMLKYPLKGFQLEGFFAYIKSVPKKEFLKTFLEEKEEVIEEALSTEEGLIAYYQNNRQRFLHYYGIEVLFRKTEWLIDLFEHYALEFRTKEAEQYLKKYSSNIREWETRICEGAKELGSLAYSEKIMGKSFFNRGPYEKFYFMPSIFIPMMACRWFGKDQILIFDCIRWDRPDDHHLSDALKMMSDRTRYGILVLLKDKKRLNGVEIAEAMKLSTSTVSHHMNQLKSCGLVNEESAGSTKYYSVNEHSIKNYISILEKTFL